MRLVKNVIGTTGFICRCGSWLNHWKKFSRLDEEICSEINCLETDVVGAHVTMVGTGNLNWYIVPLCQEHNKSTEELDIGTTVLVSANKQDTCERF